MTTPHAPGSAGEHSLQERYDTVRRAAAFYDNQMLDRLNDQMVEFIAKQEMAFIATADAHGECDATFRAGPAGFIRVLDDKTLIYPEYRGNGVMASLGNMSENGHIGILFVDFFEASIGLHVNGKSKIIEQHVIEPMLPLLERLAGVDALHDPSAGKKTQPERWVMVDVEEAYIHCSKHIPMLRKLDKDRDWGTDDTVRKGGDFFGAKRLERPWAVRDSLKAAAAAAEELDEAAAALAEARAREEAPAEELLVTPLPDEPPVETDLPAEVAPPEEPLAQEPEPAEDEADTVAVEEPHAEPVEAEEAGESEVPVVAEEAGESEVPVVAEEAGEPEVPVVAEEAGESVAPVVAEEAVLAEQPTPEPAAEAPAPDPAVAELPAPSASRAVLDHASSSSHLPFRLLRGSF